jgi:hypothetical protein
LEKDYYKAAVTRLKSCVNQIDLFTVKAEKELVGESAQTSHNRSVYAAPPTEAWPPFG